MGQRRARSPRWGGEILVGLLLLFSLASCLGGNNPLPSHREARTILPADQAQFVDVLPDGRRILFSGPYVGSSPLMLLDVATGQETLVSKEITTAFWIGDELLYGEVDSIQGQRHFAVNLQPLSVIELESLPHDSQALPGHIREADEIYVLQDGLLLLLLTRGQSGQVTGGYAAMDVRNLDVLLAGIPYKTPPPILPYNSGATEYYSPDGQYYYIIAATSDDVIQLQIHSQQGQVLNSVTASTSYLTCYGWAWDSSGVYFNEYKGAYGSPPRVGPLQLLPVKP